VRDYAQVRADGTINEKVAHDALKLLDVDEKGFDHMDRKILLTIIDKFGGGPVGVETISSAISEEKETIEDVYEPFLIQSGYINRTSRGRVATAIAYAHLGRIPPQDSGSEGNQSQLFD
jgi:Holliday junction DNA helicase RuvB